MASILALNLAADFATCILADVSVRDGIIVREQVVLPIVEAIEPASNERPPADDGTVPEVAETTGAPLSLREIDAEDTIAVIAGETALYYYLSLPFRDPKKLEQIVPLQLQDLLPFDTELAFVDSLVTGENSQGEFDVLASVVAREEISSSLAKLQSLGFDPGSLTVMPSAATGICELYSTELGSTFGLLVQNHRHTSFAVYCNNRLVQVRGFTAPAEMSANATDLTSLIASSLLQIEREFELAVPMLYTLGAIELPPDGPLAAIAVESLPLPPGNTVRSEDLPVFNQNPWALGVFARELAQQRQRAKKTLLMTRQSSRRNFELRQREYAPIASFAELKDALANEALYIVLAVLLAFSWLISVVYSSSAALTRIEDEIARTVKQEIPDTVAPRRRELIAVQDEVRALEEKLSGIGSLSTISPLDCLRELSTAIGGDIDLKIDVMNIGHTGVSMRGTVSETKMVGRLNTALEGIKRFCEVRVEPKGSIDGGKRVSFSADVVFCK